MFPKKTALLIILAICLCPVSYVQAQSGNVWDFVKTKLFGREYIEIGGQIGAAGYIGDMDQQVFGFANNNVLGFNSYSAGVSVKRYFNPIHAKDRTWGIRLDYNFNNIRGEDALSSDLSNQDRNLKFTNNIHEISATGEFHFYEFRPNRLRNIISPYVFAGVGMIYHDPKAKNTNGKMVSLIDEMVEVRDITYQTDGSGNPDLDLNGNRIATNRQKYKKTSWILPIGAGVKVNGTGTMAPWSFGLELNYRFAFTDFLDGVGNKPYESYATIFGEPQFVDPMVPTIEELDLHNSWTSYKEDWEKLAGPHNSIPYQDLVNSGYTRGQRGNDSYITTVIRVTYTFYKWRDPLWK